MTMQNSDVTHPDKHLCGKLTSKQSRDTSPTLSIEGVLFHTERKKLLSHEAQKMKSKRGKKRKERTRMMAFFIRPAPLHMGEGSDQTATSKTQEDFFYSRYKLDFKQPRLQTPYHLGPLSMADPISTPATPQEAP